jgi:hypothetical protein
VFDFYLVKLFGKIAHNNSFFAFLVLLRGCLRNRLFSRSAQSHYQMRRQQSFPANAFPTAVVIKREKLWQVFLQPEVDTAN